MRRSLATPTAARNSARSDVPAKSGLWEQRLLPPALPFSTQTGGSNGRSNLSVTWKWKGATAVSALPLLGARKKRQPLEPQLHMLQKKQRPSSRCFITCNTSAKSQSDRPRRIHHAILRRQARQRDVVLHIELLEQTRLVRIDGLCTQAQAPRDLFLAVPLDQQ